MIRVLVADDEPDLEQLLTQKFRAKIRNAEWEFVFVANGSEAIDKLNSDPLIDVLLTDINMPVMDGLTLLTRIKENNLLHKSIVVSAYGDMNNIRTAMNRGAFDFVVKPIDFIDLEITLQKTIDEMKNLKEAIETKMHLDNVRKEKEELLLNQNKMLEQKVEERTEQLRAEKKKSDDLLHNILPEEIANELKQKGSSEARLYEHVSVLFTDFVNFTGISEKLSPKELVSEIDHCFKGFDEIMERHGMEKIKTIGDAYLAVCGLPHENNNHAQNTAMAAKDIVSFMQKRKQEGGLFEIRIGIHSGALVAGIVGSKKFAYDIWGDTVNTASRMESNSEAGRINISDSTFALIKNEFACEHRGKIDAKNKGMVDMYFVN